MHFPPAQLRRFFRNEDRLERFLRISLEEFYELLMYFLCVDVSHYDEREIVRNVARFVILHHLLLRKLIVDLDLPDHRKAVRMSLVSGGKKKQGSHAVGVIQTHGEFAPNHFLFFKVFLGRQSRVHHRICQNVQRSSDTVFRHIDPKNRVIERCVSVDVTANILDLLRDYIGRSCLRALKEHVFENVRQARTQMVVLIHATSGTPRLDTCHRRAVVFMHDERQPIWQDPFLRRAGWKGDNGRIVDRCSS